MQANDKLEAATTKQQDGILPPAPAPQKGELVLSIEVRAKGRLNAPKVRFTASENADDIDIMVLCASAVGVIYAVVRGKGYSAQRKTRVKFLEIIQRYMTAANKGGLTQE